MNNRLIKSNDAGGGGACTNTVDLYNPFPDGGGVALYQLNGDATDVSGNYNGTATNVTYGTGQFGQAGVFNGSTSYVTLPITQSNDISISAWVKIEDLTRQHQIVSYDLGGVSSNRCLQFRVEFDQTVSAYWFSGTKAVTTSSLSQGVWAHVVATWQDNGTQKIYFNGVEEGSNPATTRTNFPNLFIGKRNISGSTVDDFLGSIDQVRIFNRALRPYEVEALYTEEYCTPTIVPSEHFNTNTWNGGTPQSINAGFEPDLIWIKSRGVANNHILADTVRGIDGILYSNLTNAEASRLNSIETTATGYNLLDTWAGRNDAAYNGYVGWSWKAGGAAVTNTDGTITSQVSANTEAGFSVVKYFSNFSSSNSASVGHGLTQAPQIIISKGLDTTSNWRIRTNTITGSPYDFLEFDTGSIGQLSSSDGTLNMPTDTKFDVNWNSSIGASGNTIAYCFAEVEGFSNFGSYVGTGAAGNTVVTGFEPAFVMLKSTSAAGNWRMWDNKRNTQNPRNNVLIANGSNSEFTNDVAIEFLENGFSFLGSGSNDSGDTFIYMAFAADPTAVEPTLEDSFNTVLYTGNGGTNSITGVGFAPDFVWIKNRNTSNYHHLFDTVRGAQRRIYSNSTDSENNSTTTLTAFGSDGFTVSSDVDVNGNGNNLVAWNWKGAELPAINSNGSIPSVVSANPAAGFSIVSYTGNGANGTVGHGLGVTPNIVLTKRRNSTSNWSFNGNFGGLIYGTNKLALNDTIGISADTNEVLAANSNNFTAGTSGAVGASGGTYIAYCFAEVAGFSKFGSYSGTGISGGNKQTTGFEPAFLLIKKTNTAQDWYILDNKRDSTNPNYNILSPNKSDAEIVLPYGINFLSDGFDFERSNFNDSGSTYIYMAFANQF